MNYHANFESHPRAEAAGKLVNYVSAGGDARVVDPRGMDVSEQALDDFRARTIGAESSGMHSFSFSDEHDPDELIEAARETLPDHLDGDYLIGVHEDTGKAHLHVAEAGSRDELYQPRDEMMDFRSDVADSVEETIG